MIMIRNVRAYIFESTGTNATHSFIHLFSKDPGGAARDLLCSRSSREYFPDLPVKLFVGIQRQNNRKLKKNMC